MHIDVLLQNTTLTSFYIYQKSRIQILYSLLILASIVFTKWPNIIRITRKFKAPTCKMDGYLDENVDGYMDRNERYMDGYMIATGQPVHEYIDSATRHVLLRQRFHGNKVKTPLPDIELIHMPKDDFLSPHPKEVEE